MIPPQLLIVLLWLGSSCGQQFYDRTDCSSATPATGYTCAAAGNSCSTFVVYRANARFSTVAAISTLFQADPDALLAVNTNVSIATEVLAAGYEVLVPIACSCGGDRVYRSYFNYSAADSLSISEIACAVYEGLVKSAALAAANPAAGGGAAAVPVGSTLRIPVKCACLDNGKDEVKYLITYPLIKNDDTGKVAEKFNVAVEQIWKFNGLNPFAPTVFPNTTVLVPVRKDPAINFSVPDSDPPAPQFLPTNSVGKGRKWSEMKKLVVAGTLVGATLIIALFISCFLYIKALKKFKDQRIKSMNSYSTPTPISSPFSTNSCLSPDLLVGIKYSLCNYSVEEIRTATNNFSEELKISSSLYRGDDSMIKAMRVESTKQLIDVHSKINHVNIVKLKGVCYGGGEEEGCSYLVFELPFNGSLRDSLLNSSASLHWHRRTQIAFDIATGLHYLHYSVTPAYTHLNLSSHNIFLNSNWRAKILVSGESETKLGRWIAPENLASGKGTSEKVEIFAFGVLMLELIAGEGGLDETGVRETMTFLGGCGVNEGGCFEQLRKFVDPSLKDDYPLAEALCLAVLAGSCVEDDPKHRPSMEDVLKILARMV